MDQDHEQFTPQVTGGANAALDIAGPGSRSYAFIIDWHIRLLLALAWLVLASLMLNGFTLEPAAVGLRALSALGAPPLAIYFLYHPILELLMRGQTPGKRMAGVRVVNRAGGAPSSGAILIRNLFRLIDSLPIFYLVGLVATFLTEQRIRIGDLAAGTLLVTHSEPKAECGARVSALDLQRLLDPDTVNLIEQILERWKSLDIEKRTAIARSLLQRIDAHPPRAPGDMTDEELRARLRALASN